MNKPAWLRGAVALGVGAWIAGASLISSGQMNPPWVTIPNSAAAMGEVTTVTGGNFTPGSVVTLKLTPPGASGWSRTVGVGPDGKISYPIHFGEEGLYKLEV